MNPNDPFAEKPEKLGLYNPLKFDFECQYDTNTDPNKPPKVKTFTIPSQEIEYFPYSLGLHIKKHLADAVMNDRELSSIIPKNMEEVLEEITV